MKNLPCIATACITAVLLAACGGGGNSGVSAQPGAVPQSNVAYAQQGAATQSLGSQALAATESEPAPPIPDVPLAGSTVRTDLTSPIVNDSGSYPGGPIIVGSNTGSAGTGVEGKAGAAGGYGLMGLSANTASSGKNIGVYGDGTGPGAYGVYGYSTKYIGVYGITGTGSGFGGYFANLAGGVALKASGTDGGILGESTSGSGVEGETSFPSKPFGSWTGRAGALGNDVSTDGGYNDAGVAGVTNHGYGVIGVETGSNGNAVFGQAEGDGGVAIFGFDESAPAVGYAAVVGQSDNNIGVFAKSYSTSEPAMFAFTNKGAPAIVTESGGESTMSVDASGDMILAGNLTVDGTISASTTPVVNCGTGCSGPLISTPDRRAQVERVGDAKLTAGAAYVKIDPSFARQLDASKGYHVFVTPDGDSEGWLYVAGKDAGGFTVRESHHGTSNVPFDYRIVATLRQASLPTPIHVRMPGQLRLQQPLRVR